MPLDGPDYNVIIERLREAARRVEQLDQEIESARQKARRALEVIRETVEVATEWIDRLLAQIERAVAAAKRYFSDFVNVLEKILTYAEAPLTAKEYGLKWLDVNKTAQTVAGIARRSKSNVSSHWEGPASTGYKDNVDKQAVAAQRVGTIAQQTSAACGQMYWCGVVYYGAMSVAAVKLVATVAGGIAMLCTGEFAAPGMAVILGGCAMFAAEGAAASAGFVAKQGEQGAILHGLAISPEGFDWDGTWPRAVKAEFIDALPTSQDNDKSEWRPRNP
jgi:hypothetical protein